MCDRYSMTSAEPLSHPRPVAIDLFAGAGGLSLGFEMAGFDVVSAVEYDPVHAATHLYNFPLTDVLCRDVSRISATDLLASAQRGWSLHNPGRKDWDTKVDVIVGGPSCQGFSVMGKRDEHDERNKLLAEFARLVVEVGPRAFVMENVPGMLSPQYAKILDNALSSLRDAGYTINDHATPLDATNFGVPQKRKRVVIIGIKDGDAVPPPLPEISKPVTAGDALAGLPLLGNRKQSDGEIIELTDEQLEQYESVTNEYLRTLRGDSDRDHAHARTGPSNRLSGFRATEHTEASVRRFALVPQGATEPVSRAWRISEHAPSRTLRAGTGRERGAFSASRPLHPTEPRVITVREAARLHSFPDWFRFHTTNWHGHRQIGNAVPPLLARAVGDSVLRALAYTPGLGGNATVELGDVGLLSMTPTSAARYLAASEREVPRPRVRSRALEDATQSEKIKNIT